jgi:hypothetical protein
MADDNGALLADPSSLLGQLQRGRGAGFLGALAADPNEVSPQLLTCILHDPRFDGQLERRAEYYACLAIHARLPLAPLQDYVQAHPGQLQRDCFSLPFGVLTRMACCGCGDAAAILVRYLTYGAEWAEALDAIVRSGYAGQSLADLGGVILARFPDDAVLAAEIGRSDVTMAIWDQWAAVEPRVAPIFAGALAAFHRPRSSPSEAGIRAGIDPTWDVATLVSRVTHDAVAVYYLCHSPDIEPDAKRKIEQRLRASAP